MVLSVVTAGTNPWTSEVDMREIRTYGRRDIGVKVGRMSESGRREKKRRGCCLNWVKNVSVRGSGGRSRGRRRAAITLTSCV